MLRLLLMALPVMLLLVYVFDMGMYGVWFGLAAGSVSSMFVSIFWVKSTIKRLEKGEMEIHKV